MNSTLALCPQAKLPRQLDEQGNPLMALQPGYIAIRKLTGPTETIGPIPPNTWLLHLEPGKPATADMTIVPFTADGWTWREALNWLIAHPVIAKRILEAEWPDSQLIDGVLTQIVKRGTLEECEVAGKLATAIKTQLAPHQWMGEAR